MQDAEKSYFHIAPSPAVLARFTDFSPNMRTCIQAQGLQS